MKFLFSVALLCAFAPNMPAAFELSDANRISIEHIQTRSDSFVGNLKSALDNSSWNGTKIEDRINNWNQILERAADNMHDGLDDKNAAKVERYFNHAMVVASGLNRVMLLNEFSPAAMADWRDLREDLNAIAARSGHSVLPNLVVQTRAVDSSYLDRDDVRDAIKRIADATDRFDEKFEQGIDALRSGAPEYSQYKDWADSLNDITDDMVDQYGDRNIREFNRNLQASLMYAEAINRLILTQQVFGNATNEWDTIRKDMNQLASAFGQPVLPERVVTLESTRR